MKLKRKNVGAGILMVVFTVLFFVLTSKFFLVASSQSAEGVDLIEYGKRKWLKSDVLDAKRGTMFDRNGEVIAQDIPSYSVIAILDKKYPNHIKDPEEAAEKLSRVLDSDKEDLEELLSKEGRFQVEVPSGRKVSYRKKEQIEKMKIPGVDFLRESRRYYPNQGFAAHVLGYTGNGEEGVQTGLMGLEKSLDKYLQEKDGKISFVGDAFSRAIPANKESITPPKHGQDIYLTLDEKIQLYLDEAVQEAAKKYKPEKITGIVADPKTGRILAMSNSPSFNPNKKDIKNYTNFAVSYPFEPGSTMKIFTLAAAIEEGKYNGNEVFQSGSYKLPNIGRPIYDHNKRGWGPITYNEGVQNSSNVAFSKLVREKLGYEKYRSYLSKFGLDQKTNIDLPNEKSGSILYNYEIEKVTTAFGQGTTITPIQQIQAATAIANGGNMMRPYVIDKIMDPETKKTVLSNEPKVAGKPISEETAKQVRDILETVVTDGTGKPYMIDGYSVAGKTGTAQIVGKDGKYISGWGENVFSFLGMAPKDDPKLLVYVAVERPKVEFPEMGSTPVANIFTSVMKSGLQYLNIQPEAKVKNQSSKVKKSYGKELPDYTGQSAEKAKSDLEKLGMQVSVIGSGNDITNQEPYEGAYVMKGERVILRTSGDAKMPDVKDWSYMDILRISKLLGLKETITGSGFAVKQSIKPGNPVKEGDFFVVQLEPPKVTESETDSEEEENVEDPGSSEEQSQDEDLPVTD
ncbi:penicillin-binding protein [Fictibacillus norfolkensis]|uniref:Penicillin-binding protein n=1 Tax=Fictibacillus norfolkensis TaxID=2762233 RepID=A0ABR8SLN8_9BACL|nr:penicillin-binding protein [Fictibacillus norfolkensis]MBD7964389.1 penicillin-binding protein [Fictibacillus norfolkensis]